MRPGREGPEAAGATPANRMLARFPEALGRHPTEAADHVRTRRKETSAELLRFDVGRPDHLAPLLGVIGDQLAPLRRARLSRVRQQHRPDAKIDDAEVS